jgi:hypothetical protein
MYFKGPWRVFLSRGLGLHESKGQVLVDPLSLISKSNRNIDRKVESITVLFPR